VKDANVPALLAPLVPIDCDCAGLPFMPLEAGRLVDSDLVALSTGDEFKAAVLLWCKSWSQAPAASLPDDDRILARWAGYSPTDWRGMREMALRGWIKCSDGRLYHPLIADLAVKAFAKRKNQSARATTRWAKVRGEKPQGKQQNTSTHGTAVAMQGTVEDKGTEKKEAKASQKESAPDGALRRATRLDSAWAPSEIDAAYALKKGFDRDGVERMAEKFRNYWIAKSGKAATKLDWPATWRNWVLEEAERRGVRPPDLLTISQRALRSNIL
jgi:uncharacterized protein DUF1376